MAAPDTTCGYECMCDSRADHDRQVEESRLDFLRDPGPPPAGWSEERIARARASINAARKREGL